MTTAENAKDAFIATWEESASVKKFNAPPADQLFRDAIEVTELESGVTILHDGDY